VAGGISPSGQNLVEKYNIQTGTHYNSHYLQSLIETRFDSQEITTEIRLRNTVIQGMGEGVSVTPPAPRLSLKSFMTTSAIHSFSVISSLIAPLGEKDQNRFVYPSQPSTNANYKLFNNYFLQSYDTGNASV
jgi:hypothetical protein